MTKYFHHKYNVLSFTMSLTSRERAKKYYYWQAVIEKLINTQIHSHSVKPYIDAT